MLMRSILIAIGLFMASFGAAFAETTLVMVEEQGCAWCQRWNDEISQIYPKTEEGKSAPLRRIDLGDMKASEIDFARPVVFTPTFVLVIDGQEVSRMEGYGGDEFFWFLLTRMLTEANVQIGS